MRLALYQPDQAGNVGVGHAHWRRVLTYRDSFRGLPKTQGDVDLGFLAHNEMNSDPNCFGES